HGGQFFSGRSVAVDRAAMEGAAASGAGGERAVKLELQDVCEKVTHVGDIGGHVILGSRIKLLLVSHARGRDSLILAPELPPGVIVVLRQNLSREDLPAPLIDDEPEGKKSELLESLLQQQADVLGRVGCAR